ncbi:MAG: GNAT family N-acetyltransferase [Lachnospiraceae bacterium]|nr:GNAT family N-acetyltransferase [uncultured Acetatifactor sp.]MCI8543860.1 GNAT family N-acetyltransferase [Lachnospiraceae bacterium]
MKITLTPRTAEHVKIYWKKIQDEEIRKHIPLESLSLEEALGQFEASVQPGANSFGMCIEADGDYVGDAWCYGIDEENEKMAMFSFLIFEKSLWGKGVGSEAARLFCTEALSRYKIRKLGAFTYAENIGSLKALQKAGFFEKERFLEEGRLSVYLERLKSVAHAGQEFQDEKGY